VDPSSLPWHRGLTAAALHISPRQEII